MFQGMIDEAKAAVQDVLAAGRQGCDRRCISCRHRLFDRGANMQLVNHFGGITASWMIAAAFALLG